MNSTGKDMRFATGGVLAEFMVPGPPKGKGRPRFSRASGRAYTPADTASYENLVKVLASEAMDGVHPSTHMLHLHVACYTPMPKATSKKVLAAFAAREYEWPDPKRPDLDNVIKAVTDGMNGVVYRDDSQIS